MKVSTTRFVKYGFTLLALFAISLLSAQTAKISIQGILKQTDGQAVPDGSYDLTFRLYDAETGGTKVHEQTTPTNVFGGVYSAILSGFGPAATFAVPYYFSVEVGGQELSPRVELTSSPTALSLIGQDNVFPSSGNVGIGFSSPGYKLDVSGNGRFTGTVGIGTAPTAAPLTLPSGANGLRINLYNNTEMGIGIGGAASSQEVIYTTRNQTAASHVFRRGGVAGTELMRIYGDGKVKLGSNSLGLISSLTINQNSYGNKISLWQWASSLANSLTGFGWYESVGGGSGQRLTYSTGSPTHDHVFYGKLDAGNGTELMRIAGDGAVTIGNNFASYGLLSVHGSRNSTVNSMHFLAANSPGVFSSGGGNFSYSIYANSAIRAFEFHATSDARVKDVIGSTNNAEDLTKIRDIKIRDYKYIDKIEKGDRVHKKVIAQELKEVYPEAVSVSVGVIPDIYKLGTIKNGRVSLANTLKEGDRVQLVLEDSKEIFDVLTADANGFTVASEKEGKVFVYGREVKDFHLVDYEALTTLNISATQELLKKITAQQDQIKQLQNQQAQLQDQNNDLLSRFEVLATQVQQLQGREAESKTTKSSRTSEK